MDHYFKGLIATALACFVLSANAGYAQLVPPTAWTPAASGTSGFFSGAASNLSSFANGSVSTNATLNVGGRTASIPASLRFAANAPRMAASAVMMHPGLRTAAAVAGWLGLAGLVYDAASNRWTVPDPNALPSSGAEYSADTGLSWSSSAQSACDSAAAAFVATSRAYRNGVGSIVNGRCFYSYDINYAHSVGGQDWKPTGWTEGKSVRERPTSCPVGWYSTSAGCTQTPPPKNVTEEEAIDELTKHPMPDSVPGVIPSPLPVETPDIPPTFIPTGDPVRNPNYSPSSPTSPSNAPSSQPGIEIRHAPMANSPWSVSITARNEPITDPNAAPDRDPRPLTATPPTGGTSPPQDTELDFCERYPNILACQTLEHENDDTKLPTKDIDFSFNPIPGFQGAKSCPAFPNVGSMLGGKQISWQPFCDTLAKISNLLLAFAWASAAFIILGYGRGD